MTIIHIMNFNAIDLNLLRVFDALMAERHVTRAGGRVGLSQPAMSNALSRLRALVDDPLFERDGRAMRPTARALTLAPAVREALASLERALSPAPSFDPALADRRFVFGSSDYTDVLILPELTARLAATAPGIELVVRRTDRIEGPGLIESGAIDLAFTPVNDGLDDLHSEPLFVDDFLTLAAKRHPDIRGRLDLETFLALPHVVVTVEGQGATPLDNALAARGLSRRIVLRVPSFTLIPFVVRAGPAIATLPARLAQRLAAIGGIRLHEPPLKTAQPVMHIVWHPRNDQDPAHRWLREQIVHALGDTIARKRRRASARR